MFIIKKGEQECIGLELRHLKNKTFSHLVYACVLGASGRPGGAGHCRVCPPQGLPAGGGAARKGETAEAERGEAPAAGGGPHSDHRANQPAGEHR